MDEPARRAPVVVLTALELEYAAVRRHLADGVHARTHPSGTIFEVGRLPGGTFPVALGVTGEGNTSVAALTERAVAMFAPDALLFDLPEPPLFAPAVAVEPVFSLTEGSVGDLPRSSAYGCLGLRADLRIPAEDAVSTTGLTAVIPQVAAELTARVLTAFRHLRR